MENKNYSEYFQEQIFQVFKEENLRSLADDFEGYLTIQGVAIDNYRNRYFRNFNKVGIDENVEENNVFIEEDKVERQNEKLWKLYSDIEYCNSDLKLFTANLYILRTTINNPTKEKTIFLSKVHHKYHQNFSDWNYSALVSCCYEKLYNYWDRIGDVLAFYLKLDIKEIQINFASVIDYLDKKKIFSNNENFIFLKSFKENQYKEFNGVRKEVVHYNLFETNYKYDFNKFKNDEEKIMKIWKWKNNMPEYFKNHLELSLLGYKHCFKFVEETF